MRNMIFVCLALVGCSEVAVPPVAQCAVDEDCMNGYHCNEFFGMCERDIPDDAGPVIVDDAGEVDSGQDAGIDEDSGSDAGLDTDASVDAFVETDGGSDAGPICPPVTTTDYSLECFTSYEYSYTAETDTHEINFADASAAPVGAVYFPMDIESLPSNYTLSFEIRRVGAVENQSTPIYIVVNDRAIANTIPFRSTNGLSANWNTVEYRVSESLSMVRMVVDDPTDSFAARVEDRSFTTAVDVPLLCLHDFLTGLYFGGSSVTSRGERNHYEVRNIRIVHECL